MKFCFVVLTIIVVASAAQKLSNLYRKPITSVKTKPGSRIVGGHEATPHSLPYQAFLTTYSEDSGWYCTGALISANYILTSGNCGYGMVKAEITLGAHNINEQENSQVEVVSTEITVHPDYNSTTLSNDIALIKLPSPVSLTPAIQPIYLPSGDDIRKDYVGALSITSGWGMTHNDDENISDVLLSVQVVVITNDECVKVFGNSITSSQICSSGTGGVGACTGDAGAPLVTDGVLIGVNSFVAENCTGGYPSGYTRVTHFLPWIIENTDV